MKHDRRATASIDRDLDRAIAVFLRGVLAMGRGDHQAVARIRDELVAIMARHDLEFAQGVIGEAAERLVAQRPNASLAKARHVVGLDCVRLTGARVAWLDLNGVPAKGSA
jgi:hypothetical protein